MLVSHRKKFIYTKTKKTASTSVEIMFEPFCMPDGEWEYTIRRNQYVSDAGIIGRRGRQSGNMWYNHMSARKIKEQIGDNIWNEYYKFCTIRNPFDKMISLFHFTRNVPTDDSNVVETFRRWISKHDGRHVDRDKYMIRGTQCVDFFVRYEYLQEDLEEVCSAVDADIDFSNMPVVHASSRSNDLSVADYYDSQATDRVSNMFDWEISTFGYSMP